MGRLYHPSVDFDEPLGTTFVTKNYQKSSRKISNKTYNINTGNFKKLTCVTDKNIINLYKKLEEYILKKDTKIIRNYLKKCISFKYNNKFLEINFKRHEFLLIVSDEIIRYDTSNKLEKRKGYEKNMSHYIVVNDEESLKYAIMISDRAYEEEVNPYMKNYLKDMYNILSNKVLSISDDINVKEVEKGYVFYSQRNFLRVAIRNDYIVLALLNVEDNINFLSDYLEKGSPFKKQYKLYKKEDIDKVIPYIIKSYERQKLSNYYIKYVLDYEKEFQEKNDKLDNITSILCNKVLDIDKSIIRKDIQRGIMFSAQRNFFLIERRVDYLYVLMLEVEDNDNILSRSNITDKELRMYYKLDSENDIDKLIPLIKKSYELQNLSLNEYLLYKINKK